MTRTIQPTVSTGTCASSIICRTWGALQELPTPVTIEFPWDMWLPERELAPATRVLIAGAT